MKTVKYLLLATLLICSTGSYAQHQHSSAKDVLKDKKMQDSIMTAICNDHMLMKNMMDHMMQSDHAMMMLSENQALMDKMPGMKQDTSMCKKMMGKMGDMQMMDHDKAKHGDTHKDSTMKMDNM